MTSEPRLAIFVYLIKEAHAVARKILETRKEAPPFTFFGVSCHLKDYRLSFHLNTALSVSLEKMDDFQGCSLYYYREEESFSTWYLLGNRSPETILFPDLKQTDFILLLEGPARKAWKEKILAKIKGIRDVLTAFEIRPETMKNHAALLADLEIHLMNLLKDSKPKYSPVKGK